MSDDVVTAVDGFCLLAADRHRNLSRDPSPLHVADTVAGFTENLSIAAVFDPPRPKGADGTGLATAALAEALQTGTRQVIILGAGFDSRGYRFRDRLRGLRFFFFEVDYGPTQEYKKQRLKEVFGSLPGHVRYISMDFTKDDLLQQLRKGGYSEIEKTLFIWEGVTPCIPESSVKNTLHFVRDHSGPGSTITFTYVLSTSPNVNNPNSRFAKWGEPHIFGFPGESASEYVRGVGLAVVSDVAMLELRSKYAQCSDGTSSLPALSGLVLSKIGGYMVASVPSKK